MRLKHNLHTGQSVTCLLAIHDNDPSGLWDELDRHYRTATFVVQHVFHLPKDVRVCGSTTLHLETDGGRAEGGRFAPTRRRAFHFLLHNLFHFLGDLLFVPIDVKNTVTVIIIISSFRQRFLEILPVSKMCMRLLPVVKMVHLRYAALHLIGCHDSQLPACSIFCHGCHFRYT